ncbi:Thyroxine 5-deiodinase [Mactra antiquata]
MKKFSDFNKIVAEFQNEADFIIIYIEEAHAIDGWSFKNDYNIYQHKTMEERINAAEMLQDKQPRCPIVVDTMSNATNYWYGGLPERLYIIMDGVIVYQGGKGPRDYRLDEVVDWLKKYTRSS